MRESERRTRYGAHGQHYLGGEPRHGRRGARDREDQAEGATERAHEAAPGAGGPAGREPVRGDAGGDAVLRSGREALYDGIAACDAEKAECQRQIDALDAQAAASAQAAGTFSCAVCGARMGGTDLFCSGCGTPADKARPVAVAAPSGRACAKCGAPLGDGDLFCMSCGTRVEPEGESGIGESGHVGADGVGNAAITSGGEPKAQERR